MLRHEAVRCSRLLPLLGALVGCARSPLEQRADDLAMARVRWQAAAISSYDFDFARSCFCTVEALGPVTIRVRDGHFASLVSRDSGTPVDTVLFAQFLTIERVFESTRQLLDAGPASFTASYDPTFGFPITVTVDPIAQAVDDELSYSVLALRPIDQPRP
jgi:hypothetical protein